MTIELEHLEETARDIGRTIAEATPEGAGFVLVLFDFGPGGHMTYLSNARREDMIAMFSELINKLDNKGTEGQGGKS